MLKKKIKKQSFGQKRQCRFISDPTLVKEIDYKKNSQAEIEKCLTFLKENIKITNSI